MRVPLKERERVVRYKGGVRSLVHARLDVDLLSYPNVKSYVKELGYTKIVGLYIRQSVNCNETTTYQPFVQEIDLNDDLPDGSEDTNGNDSSSEACSYYSKTDDDYGHECKRKSKTKVAFDPTSKIPVLCFGMTFKNMQEVKDAITRYTIMKGVHVYYRKNDPHRVRAYFRTNVKRDYLNGRFKARGLQWNGAPAVSLNGLQNARDGTKKTTPIWKP
ncbi:conserved hypothetical protein [Ricinus communis]|uniref:Transposase MuDR plant domain-containing protein n=1 Tax=Ricinus communis TaxID=3988 RepID=B9RB90_RICCO|nr:conserved hypothetical protein [Ricinus communis]